MTLERFPLVIFDMDGVLLDTTSCHARAYDDLWRSIGVSGPAYETIAGRATREVVAEMTALLRPEPGQVEAWVRFKQERARSYLASEPLLFDDTLECLDAFVRAGRTLGLGTSASRETTGLLIDRFGLRRLFAVVATADDTTRAKPAPDLYRTLISRAGVEAERTLIVEDSAAGLDAALASGAFAVSVRSGRRADHPSFLGSFESLRSLARHLGAVGPPLGRGRGEREKAAESRRVPPSLAPSTSSGAVSPRGESRHVAGATPGDDENQSLTARAEPVEARKTTPVSSSFDPSTGSGLRTSGAPRSNFRSRRGEERKSVLAVSRVLIVPAAGSGARLGASVPKLLFPVGGKPMVDYLFERYAGAVDCFTLVVRPQDEEEVRRHCGGRAVAVDLAVQPRPTGMLDAILAPLEAIRALRPADVWITWCDQIAIRAETVEALDGWSRRDPEAAVILPTMRSAAPYVHFVRDEEGEIRGVLHRREGDEIPETGESDMGLFRLSPRAFFELLPAFAAERMAGPSTGERNFLPFLPWLRGRARVRTFPGHDPIEAVGVNTLEDATRLERHFRHER